MPRLSVFANYSRGLQVPSTDFLYNSFFFPLDTPQANPEPETTDNFDLGVRYRSGDCLPRCRAGTPSSRTALARRSIPISTRRVPKPRHGPPLRFDAELSAQIIPELLFRVYGSYCGRTFAGTSWPASAAPK